MATFRSPQEQIADAKKRGLQLGDEDEDTKPMYKEMPVLYAGKNLAGLYKFKHCPLLDLIQVYKETAITVSDSDVMFIWTTAWQTNKMTCALRAAWASTQSDQSSQSAWRNLGSLAIHWAHGEDWSDWADAQADPETSLGTHHFVGFLVLRLIYDHDQFLSMLAVAWFLVCA